MKKGLLVLILFILSIGLAATAQAQVIVCVPPAGSVPEHDELVNTLTSLGHTIRDTGDALASDCTVLITYPGVGGFNVNLAWVQAGNGLVQISDHGPDYIPNAYSNIGPAPPPVAIDVIDGAHPITTGLPANWLSNGFWFYDPGVPDDYIGWGTDAGDPDIIQVNGNARGLTAEPEVAGYLVYIGWNVYGASATADDVTILNNSIYYAAGLQPPGLGTVPTMNEWGMIIFFLLAGGVSVLYLRKRKTT